jgi:hypothetical protein
VSDFNADGIPDLVVGSTQRLGTGGYWGAYYLVNGRGNAALSPYLPRWPITVTSFSLLPLLAQGTSVSPLAGDFDGDGVPDTVLYGNASDPFLLPTDPGVQNPPGSLPTTALPDRLDPETGQPSRGLEPTRRFGADSAAPRADTMAPLFSHPSAGDLNQDGVPDIVAAGTYLSVAQSLSACSERPDESPDLLAMWDGRTGAMLPGSPVPIEDLPLLGGQAIADINGDGYPEVIGGSAAYFVHAVDACGREPEGWPKFTGQWMATTPAVGDITGDGQLEVVAVSRSGNLFAWRTTGTIDGVIAWESFHHDNRNTGSLSVDLEQGTSLGTATPLQVDPDGHCYPPGEEPQEPAPPGLAPGGGCLCSTPAKRESALGWWVSALLGVSWIGARRRQRSAGRHAAAPRRWPD